MRNIAKYETDYLQQPFETYQVEYRKRKILERLALYPHGTILEIGCAMDPLYRLTQDFEQLVIVEPGDHFCQMAVEGAGDRDNVECVHGFVQEEIPRLQAYSYDFIVLSSLLHEVDDPENLLASVHRLCGPSTVVHVNVPNARSFHRLLALEMGLIESVYEMSQTNIRMQQREVFDLGRLTRVIESAGFAVLEGGSYFLKPFTHSQMAALIEAGTATEQMIEAFYGMVRHMPDLGSEIFVDARKPR